MKGIIFNSVFNLLKGAYTLDYLIFTIIIWVYNGVGKIEKCLDALIKQSYPKNKYNVIVVDDGSSDNIIDIVSKYESITLISHDRNYGLGKARNTGINSSNGDIITFTDDDCIPDVNWIENLAKKFSDPNVKGVGGKIDSFNIENIIEKYIALAKNPIYIHLADSKRSSRIISYFKNFFRYNQITLNDNQELYSIMGANSSYRKEILIDIGGCDDNLKRGVDWDLNMRIHSNQKLKFVYAEDAIVFHEHRSNFKNFIKHMYAYGKAQSIVAKKHGFFNYPYPLPSLIILFTLISIISFFGNIILSQIWIFSIILIRIFNFSLIMIVIMFLIYLIREVPYSIKMSKKLKSFRIIIFFPLLEIIREFFHSFGTFVGYLKKYKYSKEGSDLK